MSDLEKPLLSTSDEIPSTAVLLERLRAENKQPTIKVPGCVGCGQLHRGLGERIICLNDSLVKARATAVLSAEERAELVALRAKVERLEREEANRSLQARGRG
jgi:hypothetical protein